MLFQLKSNRIHVQCYPSKTAGLRNFTWFSKKETPPKSYLNKKILMKIKASNSAQQRTLLQRFQASNTKKWIFCIFFSTGKLTDACFCGFFFLFVLFFIRSQGRPYRNNSPRKLGEGAFERKSYALAHFLSDRKDQRANSPPPTPIFPKSVR